MRHWNLKTTTPTQPILLGFRMCTVWPTLRFVRLSSAPNCSPSSLLHIFLQHAHPYTNTKHTMHTSEFCSRKRFERPRLYIYTRLLRKSWVVVAHRHGCFDIALLSRAEALQAQHAAHTHQTVARCTVFVHDHWQTLMTLFCTHQFKQCVPLFRGRVFFLPQC